MPIPSLRTSRIPTQKTSLTAASQQLDDQHTGSLAWVGGLQLTCLVLGCSLPPWLYRRQPQTRPASQWHLFKLHAAGPGRHAFPCLGVPRQESGRCRNGLRQREGVPDGQLGKGLFCKLSGPITYRLVILGVPGVEQGPQPCHQQPQPPGWKRAVAAVAAADAVAAAPSATPPPLPPPPLSTPWLPPVPPLLSNSSCAAAMALFPVAPAAQRAAARCRAHSPPLGAAIANLAPAAAPPLPPCCHCAPPVAAAGSPACRRAGWDAFAHDRAL